MKKLQFMLVAVLGLGLAQLASPIQAEEEIASARKILPNTTASQCLAEVNRVLNEEEAYQNNHNRIVEGGNTRLILYGGDENGENHDGAIVLSCFDGQLVLNVYRQEEGNPPMQDFIAFIGGKIFPGIAFEN